jgi:MYXO-CTERM domain-containing protein
MVGPAFAQTGAGSPSSAQSGQTATQPNGTGSNPSGAPGAGTAAGTGQTVPGTDMNSPSRNDDRGDHGFNFGWLGLIGLAGLLGLRRNSPRVDEVRNIDNTGPSGVR